MHVWRLLRTRIAALGSEAAVGMVETVIALALFVTVSTALGGILTSSVDAHGFALDQSLAQEAADAQIEDVRALPYDQVGTQSGNPPGSVAATEAASTLGVAGLAATVTTSIHYVGDGVPGAYNQLTNYKQVAVTVTRGSDFRRLASELTYIAPPTRAPYGGISQVALGVHVIDIGDNEPVPGVAIALQTGPSAPRSDTTDTSGGVLFAGMTANPTTGSQAYYDVSPTLPGGYQELSGDVTRVQLSPGQLSNLSLSVYQPATIDVDLTKDGAPFTGSATVTVAPPSGSPQSYTVTGGSGSIPNLIPNGQYAVSATTVDGLVASPVTETVPDDYPADLTSRFDLALTRPNGTLSVTVANAGTPLAGSAVMVTGGPNAITLSGTTDSSGVANFPTVPAGTPGYTVSATVGAASAQQTGVPIAANSTTTVTLGVPVGSAKVTVKSGATPVPGAAVTLTGPNGFSAAGTTDGSGSYVFTSVGSGSGYTLAAADGAATAQQNGVSISAGSTTNVPLSLPVGSVKVTVTNGSSPIAGATVTLAGPNSFTAIGSTNASGVFTFTSVGAGTGYAAGAAYGAGTAQQGGLTVTSGSTTTASLAIQEGTAQVTLTRGGTPVAGATVTLTGPSSFSATASTDSSGRASFANLGAGSGYAASAANGAATVQQTGISVAAGSTTPVSLAIPVGSIQVTVSQGGTPLAGAAVALSGPTGYSSPPGTTSGAGVVTFTNVPAGPGYTVATANGAATAQQSGLAVTAGSTTAAGLTISVGSIKATVSANGSGVSGASVTVTGPNSYSVTGSTSSGGSFTFVGTPTGSGYTVSATYGATVQQTAVSVSSGGTSNVNLTIPVGTVKVTVQSQSGTALQGAAVSLAATNGVSIPAGTTNSSGQYTFTGVPGASGYTVTAKDGGASVSSSSLTVASGSTASSTITVQTGTVKVTVKNSSSGCSTRSNQTVVLTGASSYSVSGTTASNGTITFSNVPSGGGYTASTPASGSNGTASVTVATGSQASVTLSQNRSC